MAEIEKSEPNPVDAVKQEIPKVKTKKMMQLTLKELEMLKVELKDVFSFEGLTINLTWEKVIRVVNYNAGRKVLEWTHTFEEAMEVINLFLM